jgi:hypothetical protein
MTTDQIHPEVRKYFQKIGSKGGKVGKGTEWRRRLNQRAAFIRWHNVRRQEKKLKKDVEGT